MLPDDNDWTIEEFDTLDSAEGETEKPKRYEREKPKRKEKSTPTSGHSRRGFHFTDLPAFVVGTILGIIGIGVIAGIGLYLNATRQVPLATPSTLTIPTALPEVTATQKADLWEGQVFLTQEQARALRTQANVINLAVVRRNGSVSYSATSSLMFAPKSPWIQTTVLPPGLETLTLRGKTAVEMDIRGESYKLNRLQPFVVDHETTEQTVFIVDLTGQLWHTELDMDGLTPLSTVQVTLVQEIQPNPELTFTY